MKISEIAEVGEIMDVKVGDIIARAKIERLYEPNGFVIGQPTHKMVPLFIREDEACDFWFMRENGIFSFIAVLENDFILDGLRYCAFQVITPVVRKQRREAFRLPITLDVMIRFSEEEEMPAISARTIDLSQTGVMLSMNKPLGVGMKLILSMKLYENVAFVLNATVKRCELVDKKQEEYRVAVQFNWGKQHEQAVLSRYIFQKQVIRRMAMKEATFEKQN